jgi:hypothetical protein
MVQGERRVRPIAAIQRRFLERDLGVIFNLELMPGFVAELL